MTTVFAAFLLLLPGPVVSGPLPVVADDSGFYIALVGAVGSMVPTVLRFFREGSR